MSELTTLQTDTLRIHAIIPNIHNPEEALVGPDGEYPSTVFERNGQTFEGTMRQMARNTFSLVNLSVDKRLPNTDEGSLVYQTKPAEVLPEHVGEYSWKAAPELANPPQISYTTSVTH